MSVTAASGFVAAGVHAGIRRDKLDLALVRSIGARNGCGDVDAEPGARRAGRRLEAAPGSPRASGDRDQLGRRERRDRCAGRGRRARDRRARRHAARPRARAGARALDRRDRRAAPARADRGGLDDAAAELSHRRWRRRCRRRSSPPTRSPKTAVAHGDGFSRRRHGEGLGDDPSEPRDDAGGRDDRLPARSRARQSTSCAPLSTASFNAISVDGECSTNDAVVLLSSGAAHRRTDAGERRGVRTRRCTRVCRDLSSQIVRDGEGATLSPRSTSRAPRAPREATRDRPAHRDLAARQDGPVRPRRQLGPRADGGGQRAVQRRLRAGRCVAHLALVQRHGGARRAARRSTRAGGRRRCLHDRPRPRARRRQRCAT